jgi:hypothetical protein
MSDRMDFEIVCPNGHDHIDTEHLRPRDHM